MERSNDGTPTTNDQETECVKKSKKQRMSEISERARFELGTPEQINEHRVTLEVALQVN